MCWDVWEWLQDIVWIWFEAIFWWFPFDPADDDDLPVVADNRSSLTAFKIEPLLVENAEEGPMDPFGEKANGLRGTVAPGWGPVPKYAGPKIMSKYNEVETYNFLQYFTWLI